MRTRWLLLTIGMTLPVFAGCTHFVPPRPYDVTDAIKQRSRITGSAAYQNHPEILVGRIISVKNNSAGACDLGSRVFDTWTLSRTPFTKNPQPAPEQKPNVIYQKHVEGTLSMDGTFPFVSVSGSGEGAVELVVTDLAESLGGSNIDQAAVDVAISSPWPADICARFLIENVVSSLALYKQHTKITSKSNIVGTAFGIGNEIYNSDDEFRPEALIFVDLLPLEKPGLRKLHPSEVSKRPSIQLILSPSAKLQEEDLK